jgi:hypothetical protein
MSKFVCPKCKANVQKETNDAPGCPACGFGRQQHAHGHKHDEKCSICHESCSKCSGHMICG